MRVAVVPLLCHKPIEISFDSHKAHQRVADGNFLLSGLVGFNLHGRTVGIIGTGKIGMITVCFSKILYYLHIKLSNTFV